MESAKPSPRPIPPKQYGSYVIMLDAEGKPRLLGSGTFGRTYLAQHHYLDTLAALKILNERFAIEAVARERFLREGRALVRLDHRHIARLLDFGETDGELFYAMEYCKGGDLARRVQQHGPMPLEAWHKVARQLAGALDCCHRMGFIHRDLKPSNVMLAHERDPLVVKLIDFGMVHGEHKEREGQPTMVGTPLYASPEQLWEASVDARSDLFSLGMTLWHLAIGAPPETGSSAQVISSRLSAESYAAKMPPHLPDSLRVLLTSLVEKDPAGRPQSAADVLIALRGAARELGLPGAVDPAPEEDRRKSELSDSDVTTLDPSPEPEPMEEEKVECPLGEHYVVTGTEAEQHTGLNYRATGKPPHDGEFRLHVLHPQLVSDNVLFRKLRIAATRLRQQPAPDCPAPVRLGTYTDGTVLISPAPAGYALSAALRAHGKCALQAVLPLLRRIAGTADHLLLAGLPGVELRTSCIYVSEEALLGTEGFQVTLVPRWLRLEETSDMTAAVALRDGVSGTMTAELLDEQTGADRPPIQFARLIFRLVAGRDCPAAAGASTRGYVPASELSESNNRLLSQVISGQTPHATCGAVLSELQGMGTGGGSLSRSGDAQRSASRSAVETAPAKASRPPPATASQIATVVPQPPQPPAMPREPTPGERPARPQARVLGLTVAACLALAAGVYWSTHRGGGGAPTESPAAEKLPAGAMLQMAGEFPESSVFSVEGHPVQARRAPGKADVPLPAGAPLPIDVTVTAVGFQPVTSQVRQLADLPEPVPVSFKRAKGTLVLRRHGPTDYTTVVVQMYQTLETEGMVRLDRFSWSNGVPAGDQDSVRWPLSTGSYDVRLIGLNGHVYQRSYQKATIEAGGEETCLLPPSFLGRYSGEVEESGTAKMGGATSVPLQLSLTENFTEGEVMEKERASLEEIKINAEGVLKATARYSALEKAPSYDRAMTARLSADGEELEVKFVEIYTEAQNVRAAARRPFYAESEWVQTGKLRRRP